MNISCLMITTNKPERFAMLDAAIMSIENNAQCEFKEKVLSVDWLEGTEPTLEPFKRYEKLGWTLVGGWCTGHRAMVNNIIRGLSQITSDILFYCEDHVIIECVPELPALEVLFDGPFNGTLVNIGWINYNTHIVEENLLNVPNFVQKEDKDNLRINYINNKSNYVSCWNETFLKKSFIIADEYHLNFPAAITPTEIFKRLLSHGYQHYQNIGIEIGFTKAWMELYSDKDVLIYVKNRPKKRITFKDFHNLAQIKFRNNDSKMLHESLFKHPVLPEDDRLKNNFF